MSADKERYDKLVAEHRDPAKLTAEILAYWQQEVAKSRALNDILTAEIMVAANKLGTAQSKLKDAEERLSALNDFERAAARTGYRTPYYLSGVVAECIREETAKANAYSGPMMNDYPAVLGVIGFNPAANKGKGEWLFTPDKDAMIYSGDTVIGQVLGENGAQVTPTSAGLRTHKKKRR